MDGIRLQYSPLSFDHVERAVSIVVGEEEIGSLRQGTRIQPVDATSTAGGRSRLKWLFDRQGVLRTSSEEKLAGAGDPIEMNFLEECCEKPRCGLRPCNHSSDDDRDLPDAGDEVIKGVVQCADPEETNLAADAAQIVERSKMASKRIVAEGLRSLGYDAGVCRSRWEKSKSPSIPAGEYEYVDVVFVGGERVVVDVDFRSEFEIARPTRRYRSVLQFLPAVFVGKEGRVEKIVEVVSEAARESLTKRGLHVPPWRKPEYMRAKWLAPYERTKDGVGGGFGDSGRLAPASSAEGKWMIRVMVSPWQLPAVKPKYTQKGGKVVTGLASVLDS